MSIVDDVKGTARGVRNTAVGAVKGVAKAAPVDAVSTFVSDEFVHAKNAANRVVDTVSNLPDSWKTWKLVYHAVTTGERTLLPGHTRPYTTLDPAKLSLAQARGAGQRVEQPYLQDDAKGNGANEPATLFVTGSKEDLVRALERQGWVQNSPRSIGNYARQFLSAMFRYDSVSDGPVSEMYLYGKLEDMAFSKNVDYNLARDHMRVYKKGKDPVSGKDVWAIAATRDTAATVDIKMPTITSPLPWKWDWKTPGFGHEIDKAIDGERDMIMADLLASGLVTDWKAVDGVRKGLPEKQLADGRLQLGEYTSDGKVYLVDLQPRKPKPAK
jgi:hypothetical protein